MLHQGEGLPIHDVYPSGHLIKKALVPGKGRVDRPSAVERVREEDVAGVVLVTEEVPGA